MKKLILLLFITLMAGSTYAQKEIWQVDSRIESVTIKNKGKLKIITIQVKADNDDTQRSSKLIISLPRNSNVTAVTMDEKFKYTIPYQVMGHGNLALSHIKKNIDSYVQLDLGNLNKETFVVNISISPTSGGFLKGASVSAFIFGITPELNKGNNFKNVLLTFTDDDDDGAAPNVYSFPVKLPVQVFPKLNPIYFPDICKYVIDCPGCGINALCIGDILRIPGYLDIESIELRLGKEILDIKHFRNKTTNVSAKSIDLVLPRNISKKEFKNLNLLFKKTKNIKSNK